MGFNARLRKTVRKSNAQLCVAMQHGSRILRILPRVSQVANIGNHCPEGCVLVKHSAVARGMFFVD